MAQQLELTVAQQQFRTRSRSSNSNGQHPWHDVKMIETSMKQDSELTARVSPRESCSLLPKKNLKEKRAKVVSYRCRRRLFAVFSRSCRCLRRVVVGVLVSLILLLLSLHCRRILPPLHVRLSLNVSVCISVMCLCHIGSFLTIYFITFIIYCTI